jgi:hypothetical protein
MFPYLTLMIHLHLWKSVSVRILSILPICPVLSILWLLIIRRGIGWNWSWSWGLRVENYRWWRIGGHKDVGNVLYKVSNHRTFFSRMVFSCEENLDRESRFETLLTNLPPIRLNTKKRTAIGNRAFMVATIMTVILRNIPGFYTCFR